MNVEFPVKNSTYGSLPPLIEGEVFSYLTLKVDHILWRKKPPGDVAVLARWWGDNTIPVFKPSDVRNRCGQQTDQSFIYEVRTPINLFETYLEDSEHLELFVVHRSLNELIGSAKITNLKKIIYENPYQVYVPILNSASRVGDLHVCFILHNDKTLSRNSTYKQEQCLSKETRKQIKFQKVNTKSNLSLVGRKQVLRTDDFNENHNKATYSSQYDCSSNLTTSWNSDAAPQSARKCRNDALLLKVLTQSVKLRNAMVKSILEDNDLLVRNSTLADKETTLKEHSAFRSGGSVSVSVNPNEGVMEYLLGKNISSESKEHHKALRSLTAPMPDQLKLMENTDKMDDSFVKMRHVSEDEVIPVDCISGSEQQDSQSRLLCKNDKLSCSEKFMSSDTTANNTQLQQHDKQSLNDIRWLRVDVCRFVLQLDNVLKVLGTKFLPRSSFFAEFELPGNLVCPCKGKQQKPWNNRVHRFCSRKQLNNVVDFDKSISCRIQANDGDTLERIKLSKLTFTLYSRHMKQKSPVLIGTADLPLSQLLKPDASNKHEIPVFSKLPSSDGSLFVGTLIVVVEFISNKHVLNHSVVRNGNGKQDNHVLSTSSEENGLEHSAERAESDSCQNEAVQKESAVLCKLAPKTRSADIDQDSLREKILLYIILHIQEGRGFRYETTYLVTRMLWQENISLSGVQSGTEPPKYNFHEILPVNLDNNFLQRCHNNILVTEVWCDNKLLGLVKMSLEPFYNAFCNQTMRAKLLTEKMPVIGLDGWVDIVNPASGCTVGQLSVVLAAGTKTQVKNFEYSLMPEMYGLSNYKKSNSEQQLCDFDERCNKSVVNAANPVISTVHTKSHFHSSSDSSTKQKQSQVPRIISESSISDSMLPPKFVNGDVSTIISSREMRGNCHVPHGNPHVNRGITKSNDKICASNRNDVLMKNAYESSESNIESTESNMAISTPEDDSNKNFHGHVTHKEKISFIRHPNSCNRTCIQKNHGSDTYTTSKSGSSNRHCNDDPLNPGFLSSDRDISLSQTYHVFDKRRNEMENTCLNTTLSDLDEQASSVDNAITENKRRRYTDNQISSTDTVSTQVSAGFSDSVIDTVLPVHQQKERKSETCFHAHIEVINALHLPLIRKNKKRVQPSCYVTFEVSTPTCDDKKLLRTPVAWHTTSPVWDWSCDVWLPAQLLKDKSTSLVFKIWIKAETSGKEEDNILGHVSVDLTVLLFGMPWISGWFNITDFTGNNKGQMKINITPLESLTRFSIQQLSEDYQKLPLLQQASSLFDTSSIKHKTKKDAGSTSSVEHSLESVHCPTTSGAAVPALDDLGDISSFLSSALKNKLLELDEITQRLKQRLSSVTQEEEEDLSVDPEFDMDDIVRDDCSSWNTQDQTIVPGNVLEPQKHSETHTSGVLEERNVLSEKPQICSSENKMVAFDRDVLHLQKENHTLKNDQRNKLDGDYCKTVDKLATLTIDNTNHDEACRNDFDSLTSYFKDIACKDLELENVFNPLLFQQLLSCSNAQSFVQQGTHRSRADLCSSQVGDEFISNVSENIYKNFHTSEEQKATHKVQSNTLNSERMNLSLSMESCIENTENTEHGYREKSVTCNAGSCSTPCATEKSVSCETLFSSNDNLTEVKAVSESEFITNNFSSSFPSEFASVMSTQEIDDGRLLGEDSVTKPCNSLHGHHSERSDGSSLEEVSGASSESNPSVVKIQRLAPEGGNPSENSSHSQQTNTSDNCI